MSIGETLERELATVLGPHTARNAVRTFAARAVQRRPEELSLGDAEPVIEALRPVLQTLLGRDAAERIAQDLLRKVLSS